MLEYRTEGFQGYSVKYSPFFDNRIAVAAAANFGLVGNGRLYVLELTPQGIRAVKWYAVHAAVSHLSNNSMLSGIPHKTPFMMSHIQKRIPPIF